ncbi:MAG TPA: GNAT family N-acetyltransferase [Candidatus Tumulicola sp.]|jgi:RimJ/RimL family protein N-acetyltransferase
MNIIRTQRLRLEPVRPDNSAVLWQVLQAPGLREYQDLPSVDAAQFKRTVAARPPELTPEAIGRFEWLIRFANPDRREPLGWVSLRIADRSPTAGEIGYSVVREQRGRGIASEAVRAILIEAFETAKLRTVRAYCVPDNLASRQVLARSGFEDEGVMPNGAMVAGRSVDVIAHSLERERWNELRTQSLAR